VPHIVTISGSDTRPRLWNLATGEASSTTFQPRQSEELDSISDLAVGNLDGKQVAICVALRCYVWDLSDGTLLLDSELDDGHGAVTLWNLDGSITQIIETGSPVFSLAIDGQKRIICSGIMGILTTEIT
jgi:WD40 repeat protein